MKIYVGCAALIWFSFTLASLAQQPIVEPTDRPVALAGTLSIIHAYGPPGYGEDKKNDVKVSYWAVKLGFTVKTICTPQLPDLEDIQCGSTDKIRLFFPVDPEAPELKKKARSLIGRQVLVTGMLHRRESMSDYTKIYMNVTEIAKIASTRSTKSH